MNFKLIAHAANKNTEELGFTIEGDDIIISPEAFATLDSKTIEPSLIKWDFIGKKAQNMANLFDIRRPVSSTKTAVESEIIKPTTDAAAEILKGTTRRGIQMGFKHIFAPVSTRLDMLSNWMLPDPLENKQSAIPFYEDPANQQTAVSVVKINPE